jgi:type I restriction enzyme R subunit
MVREQMELIEEVAGEEWWTDVTVPMLEVARKRLRALIKLIDKAERKTVYTDFEDVMGDEVAARAVTSRRRFGACIGRATNSLRFVVIENGIVGFHPLDDPGPATTQ